MSKNNIPIDTTGLPQLDAALTGILAGDNVSLEMSPYDLSKGRITFRHLENARSGPPPRRPFSR